MEGIGLWRRSRLASFTPTRRPGEEPRRGQATNHKQEQEACDEKEPSFHLVRDHNLILVMDSGKCTWENLWLDSEGFPDF